ncbi:MAG: hydrogenase formation protein HypD [Bacteroidales bacterium]
MKYIDEYRNGKLIETLKRNIREETAGSYTFMEVCGGHTAAIHRFGIPSLLPDNVNLLSGPGCPVCVTAMSFINKAVSLALFEDIIITSFGDLIRVPGSVSSLEKEKSRGADVRIVFSALEALETAVHNKDKKVVFMGIGFETTAPGTAAAVIKAKESGITNFFVLSAHKIMPPAMEAIISDGTEIDGFICPGHVATITGANAFRFISEKHNLGCVISGFEPVDILMSVLMLIRQINSQKFDTEIQYSRAVTREGNVKAQGIMNEVFSLSDAEWRGLGIIGLSGLALKEEYSAFDAEKVFHLKHELPSSVENSLCLCGEVLRGRRRPTDCRLFGNACTPENPLGACMVSAEGACNAFYKYRKDE